MPNAWSLVFCSLVHLLKFFSDPLQKWSRVSCEDSPCTYPFDKFLPYNFVSSSFFVLLRYAFLIFSFFSTFFDGVTFQYSQVFTQFPFLRAFYFFFPDLVVLFLRSCFPLFIICMAHFSISNSIPGS